MNQRLEKIVEIFGKGEQKNIASKIGVGERTFNNYVGGFTRIPLEVFENIKKTFPQLDSDWLLLGEGEMLKPNFNNDDNTKPIQLNQQLRKKSYEHISNSTVDSSVQDSTVSYTQYPPELLEELEALRDRIKTLEIENAQLERMLLKK